jgi:hypothetical protein
VRIGNSNGSFDLKYGVAPARSSGVPDEATKANLALRKFCRPVPFDLSGDASDSVVDQQDYNGPNHRHNKTLDAGDPRSAKHSEKPTTYDRSHDS